MSHAEIRRTWERSMGLVVRPAELEDGARCVAAHAAGLDALLVVARLESAAQAAPGTELAAAANAAADALRLALLRCRLQLAAAGCHLDAAATVYVQADALSITRRAQ
jgi:hypothetical protein